MQELEARLAQEAAEAAAEAERVAAEQRAAEQAEVDRVAAERAAAEQAEAERVEAERLAAEHEAQVQAAAQKAAADKTAADKAATRAKAAAKVKAAKAAEAAAAAREAEASAAAAAETARAIAPEPAVAPAQAAPLKAPRARAAAPVKVSGAKARPPVKVSAAPAPAPAPTPTPTPAPTVPQAEVPAVPAQAPVEPVKKAAPRTSAANKTVVTQLAPVVEASQAEPPHVEAPVMAEPPVVAPAAAAYDAPPTWQPARAQRRGLWVVVLVVVLLFAAAAGLGTAAIVKNRAPVWEARATVTLLPGSASSTNQTDALAAGQRRYIEKVRNAGFTGIAALKSGMPDSEVVKTVVAQPGPDGTLVLVAEATTDKGAIALANGSAVTLVDTVASDQRLAAATPGDRLSASPKGPSLSAVRTTPTNRSIALAGLLAAAAVLLIAGVLFALGTSEKKS